MCGDAQTVLVDAFFMISADNYSEVMQHGAFMRVLRGAGRSLTVRWLASVANNKASSPEQRHNVAASLRTEEIDLA